MFMIIPDTKKDEQGKAKRLPAGEAYKPLLYRNPAAYTLELLRVGRHCLNLRSARISAKTKDIFNCVRGYDPHNKDALLGLAESYLQDSFLDVARYDPAWAFKTAKLFAGQCQSRTSGTIIKLFRVPQELADEIGSAGPEENFIPDYWRERVIYGALFLLHGQFLEAQTQFEEAHKLDPVNTMSNGWFILFLYATGQSDLGLQILKSLSEQHVEDPFVQATYVLGLYVARRYLDARNLIYRTLMIDRHCWLMHLAACLICLEVGRQDFALKHYKAMNKSLGYKFGNFLPGLAILCVTLHQERFRPEQLRAFYHSAITERIKKQKRFDWIQEVLTCIAFEEVNQGADFLVKAVADSEPIHHFVDLLPIFDPLKNLPSYQRLQTMTAEIYGKNKINKNLFN